MVVLFSVDDSKLVVQTLSNRTKTELLSLTEAGAGWISYKLDVISETEYQVSFLVLVVKSLDSNDAKKLHVSVGIVTDCV